MWRQPLADLRGPVTAIVSSVLLGLFVFVMWIGLEEYVPYPHMGSRAGFDPGVIASDTGRLTFLFVRVLGLVIVVPVMEELLWRSLALRYFTSEDFLLAPVGRFATSAFSIMVVGFALTHSEWAAAAVTAALYGEWVWRTKSLLAVVIAHATTNAALGLYVLATGRW
jgi:CAAX prenyl protease-like protein